MIIQPPQDQSVCEEGAVNFTCVVMFNTVEPRPATWFTDNGLSLVIEEPGHLLLTDDSNGLSAVANVTNVLTLINVSISDNGTNYLCQLGERSDPAFLTIFGELVNCHVCVYKTTPTKQPQLLNTQKL